MKIRKSAQETQYLNDRSSMERETNKQVKRRKLLEK